MLVLIPAYEPGETLPRLVEDLVQVAGLAVLVVDDGSGPAFGHHFTECARLGAEVLTHPVNRGKGAALKTGFAHAEDHHPGTPVVCADSDGQHSPVDILRVASALPTGSAAGSTAMVLGARRFTGTVPTRSRFGNAATRIAFRLVTGVPLLDTQTGLRAYPPQVLPWLRSVPGDRFEYELRLLLAAAREGRAVTEVEIATIYLEGNASSHFRPLRDSARVYGQLLAFVGASLVGFGVDVALLWLLTWLTGNLALSVVGARLVSATTNYLLARHWVFRRGAGRGAGRSAGRGAGRGAAVPSVLRYAALAAALLAANLALVSALLTLTGSLIVAKLATELALFSVSYLIQSTLVFPPRGRISRGQERSGSEGLLGSRT